jgi:hypothetical protein
VKGLRFGVSALAATSIIASATPAFAQKYVAAGEAEVASGLEGGGWRAGDLGRAPTRLRIGGEVHVDEDPEDAVALGAVLDLEPDTAFGVDARYVRIFDEHYAVSVGAIGYFTPGLLVGPAATFEVRQRLGRSIWFTAGPELNVFVLGTHLPDKTVLWQGLLHAGIRVDL